MPKLLDGGFIKGKSVSYRINGWGHIFIYLEETVAKTFFQKNYSILSVAFFALTILVSFFFWQGVTPASAQTIIEEWSKVQAPKPPELKAVTLDPKGTALLVLDFVKQTCNNERRPRCLTSLPQVRALLKLARDKGLLVVHSITTAATPADILKDVAPLEASRW